VGLLAGLVIAGSTACTPDSEQPAQRPSPPRTHLVELAEVVRDTLRMSTLYTGSLRGRRSVRIFTQEEGRIVRLPYYEGDAVRAGDIVLELDDKLLRAEIDKVVANRRQAEINIERLQQLLQRSLVSEDEYIRAQTALQVAQAEETVLRTRLGYTRVAAPFDGLVTQRRAEPGDFVERNVQVLSIVDPTSLVAELTVSELVMPHVTPGDSVSVHIDALGDQRFDGHVLRIHPELDPDTRQGRVEVELKPVPDGARAGQFARVKFYVEAFNRIVIPFAALRRDRDGEYVFRVEDQRKARRVTVRSGRRLADRVEILEGLKEAEQVVKRGFMCLDDGKAVKPVERSDGGDEAAVAEGG
jgi:membrane fusion protein (multidrug efflux system)